MNAFMSFILFVFVASSNAQLSNYATNNGGGFRGSNDQFGGSSNQDSNGFGQFGSSSNVDQRIAGSSSNLDPISALEEALPGVPGEDYPIYAEVPDTFFSCDGQIEGGFYADTGTDCQAFHVCASAAEGGLRKMSFLCPTGTIFNQALSTQENEEIAAEREAIAASNNGGFIEDSNDSGFIGDSNNSGFTDDSNNSGFAGSRTNNGPFGAASGTDSIIEEAPQSSYQSRSGRFFQNRGERRFF
ncbi:unnamed protein product [Lepeophtheirus salmonis]|uniref:(salmon louse) hypothetical protein n=1 Tax=Lepeophtheirus salmonis TaxID=72036 RepID=A0A7R8H5R3_LEPSM|nr:unnamed protein product [Lepeophtheirus salmonis]CAF2872194.1 unnamed protein product [Lepeophtheirus salmonis]